MLWPPSLAWQIPLFQIKRSSSVFPVALKSKLTLLTVSCKLNRLMSISSLNYANTTYLLIIQIFSRNSKKNKLQTFPSKKLTARDSKGRQVAMKTSRDLFARVLILSKTREINLEELLSYSLSLLLLLLSNLFKRHASPTQQFAGLQEGRVQRKIARSIKL